MSTTLGLWKELGQPGANVEFKDNRPALYGFRNVLCELIFEMPHDYEAEKQVLDSETFDRNMLLFVLWDYVNNRP